MAFSFCLDGGFYFQIFGICQSGSCYSLRDFHEYSFVGRKQKKRTFRKLWITRINAAAKLNGLSYSKVIHNFKKSNIDLNRKMLSQIAILDSQTFNKLIQISQ